MGTVALYLGVTFAAGLAAGLVRLPPLVGFLVAGFVLGAAGAPELPYLETLADLGVTLLLFGIGLKFDPRSLLRREVWATTVVHMAISVAAAVGFLGLLMVAGVGMLADESLGSLALVGFALSFSSTVFVVKLLDERSDATALYGRIAIGVLILQDIAAVVFLSLSKDGPPSPWAVALVLLVPVSWLLRRALDRTGHGELRVLFGVLVALGPGYALFEAVGVKGDLGALVMGMLLASHPAATELSRHLFSLKELLLVGFFVSIGLHGTPTLSDLGVAALLLLLLPAQAVAYVGLLWLMRLRYRTTFLASLAMTNYSEFGLIVVAVGASTGLLAGDWVPTVALAVAASFVLCAAVNRRGVEIAASLEESLPLQRPERLVPDDRPIDVGRAQAVVVGMGRVGRAAFDRLSGEYGLKVAGVEHDGARVAELRGAGVNVVRADATDLDFWERVCAAGTVRVAVLAMPGENTNLLAMDRLRESGFPGRVVALARYADEVGHLRKAGVDEVFHLYGTAGVQLADYAADLALAERWLEPGAARGRYPESEPGPQVPGERADTGAGRPTMDDGVT